MSICSNVYGAISRWAHISDRHRDRVPTPLEARWQASRPLLVDPVVGYAPQPFTHQNGDFQSGQVVADAEVLAATERQGALDLSVPVGFVGLGVMWFDPY